MLLPEERKMQNRIQRGNTGMKVERDGWHAGKATHLLGFAGNGWPEGGGDEGTQGHGRSSNDSLREPRGLRGRRRPRLEARTDDGDGAETAGSGEAARFDKDRDGGLLQLAAAR